MSDIYKDIELFNELLEVLLDAEKEAPVAERIEATDLHNSLDLSLNEFPILDENFKIIIKEIILLTPKTASKLFFNQLFGGRQSKAILGDLLTVLLNNSMYTYKVAGPQVGIEKKIIRQTCQMIGYGDQSDGTFPSGGSMSNHMALLMARDVKDPNCRKDGLKLPLVVYTSSESHYSIDKNISFAGLGRNNLRIIDVDSQGRMIPQKLEEQILLDLKNGFIPTFVNATAGTTVLGAFDPINEIAKLTEKYDIWFHIDGAYLGSTIFSEKKRYLLSGIERSNSFCFNAHKMLGAPLLCSLLLVKDKKHLNDSFSIEADYLYQSDSDDFNLGKSSMQCGRRNDALKLWTLWKSIGTIGLRQIVDRQYDLADYARDYVNEHSDYTLYSFEESVSVCFNYKNVDAKLLCTALYENQETMVGYGSFNGNTFVRLVTINANNTKEDILNFFKVIEDFVSKNISVVVKESQNAN